MSVHTASLLEAGLGMQCMSVLLELDWTATGLDRVGKGNVG